MEKKTIEGANFYGICPECGEAIPFQGVDIQYYQPIGYELKNELDPEPKEIMDTGKVIGCPYCKKVSKAEEFKFVINDF